MSPVIYRPAGSGPDREPRKTTRVPFAGPDIPTAASFADELDDDLDDDLDGVPAPPDPARSDEAFDDRLDEDPDIDDSELADEAEDALLDDLESTTAAPPAPASTDETSGRNLASARRPIKQRRRRRILGRHDDPVDEEPPSAAPVEDEPVQDEPAQDEPAQDETTPPEEADHEPAPEADPEPEVDATPELEESLVPPAAVPRPRRRRVRTLNLSAPPVGDGGPPQDGEDVTDDEPADTEPIETEPVDTELTPVDEVSEDQHRAVADDETPAEPEAEADPEMPDAEMPDSDLPGATDVTAEEMTARSVAEDVPPAHEDPAAAGAISGRVRSSRLRGLRGMTVTVIDESDHVVGETLTGRRGEFVVDGLPAGTYRVGARDPSDGDFNDGWHGSVDAARATMLRLDDDAALDGIDLTLVGRVGISAEVSSDDDHTDLDIEVIDRTTGLPGVGEVVVNTEHFRTSLPLTDGRTRLTIFGSAPGSGDSGPELAPRVRIEYSGSEHSAPANRSIRLR